MVKGVFITDAKTPPLDKKPLGWLRVKDLAWVSRGHSWTRLAFHQRFYHCEGVFLCPLVPLAVSRFAKWKRH
jgi:hypothetical protein